MKKIVLHSIGTFPWEATVAFLACLHECTGRAIALTQASALAAAMAFTLALAKCQSLMLKFFYVMDKVLLGAVLHMDMFFFFLHFFLLSVIF